MRSMWGGSAKEEWPLIAHAPRSKLQNLHVELISRIMTASLGAHNVNFAFEITVKSNFSCESNQTSAVTQPALCVPTSASF
jgi:hypothetical protein